MNLVGIFGAGGCGRSVMPLARKIWADSGLEHELVFVDDGTTEQEINGHKVLKYGEWLHRPASMKHINLAIANSLVRRKLAEKCAADNISFFQVRAENVIELDHVELGEGAILCPFVTLTSNIKIGIHFHANIYSYVEHDCVIGDFVTFAPGVKCNGNVHIDDHAYIGAGAVIKNGNNEKPLLIGRGAVIGMGAVVTKNVPPNVVVIGNPAKPVLRSLG